MTLQIALTGINAASTELENISNNIANNATTGFKRARVEFADLYAISGGSSKTQTGQGVGASNVRQDFTQGGLETTNRNLDLAVQGLGMFRLEGNSQISYTRAGNFGMDEEGHLVNSADEKLTGYSVNADDELEPFLSTLKVDFSDIPPLKTSEIELVMNFDTKSEVLPPFDAQDQDTYNYSTSVAIYDSLGATQLANVYFRKDAPNSWTLFSEVDGIEVSQPGGDEVTFSESGELTTVNGAITPRYTTGQFNPASGAERMEITFDLGDVSQYDNAFGISKVVQDGYSAGGLEEFDINAAGILFGRFSNGQAKQMGQVALTNFTNEGGLKQIGNTSWQETLESGEPATGAPGSASLGSLKAGALETSNVDLTQELVAMIGAQRSFQANAQVISTSDTITQTVINMRR